MTGTFGDLLIETGTVIIIVGIVGCVLIGLLEALVFIVKVSMTRKGLSPRSKRLQTICSWIILTALIAFELVMHFRMKCKVEPLAKAFAASARMEREAIVVDKSLLGRRDALLETGGYTSIGGWWADQDVTRPRVTIRMVYLYVPF